MERKIFSESDIPYQILEEYGISQQMIDDLPQKEKDNLFCGRMTTDLPIRREFDDGTVVRTRAAISLVRTLQGTDVLFTSRWKNNNLENYTSEERNKLRNGNVIRTIKQGEGSVYAQLDEITNQVMSAKADIIIHNIDLYVESMKMDSSASQDIKDCKVLTIEGNSDDPQDILTIGVDLHSPTGIHVSEGDSISWKLTRFGEKLPKYNFGLYGCWITDNDGRLDHYILEEKYTEEMLDEENKMIDLKANERMEENKTERKGGYRM